MPVSIVHYSSLVPPYPGQAYGDTNFLLALACGGRAHFNATQLAQNLRAGQAKIAVSMLALDEAVHVLIRSLHVKSTGLWPPNAYKDNPGLPRRYKREIKQFLGALLSTPGIMLVDHPDVQREAAQAYYGLLHHGLTPRDAWHLAIATEISDGYVVTNDRDFDGLSIRRQLTIIRYD